MTEMVPYRMANSNPNSGSLYERFMSPEATFEERVFSYTLFVANQGKLEAKAREHFPLFTTPIEIVQSVSEMMWKEAAKRSFGAFSSGYFSDIVSLLRIRESEWTEEYRLFRFNRFLTDLQMEYLSHTTGVHGGPGEPGWIYAVRATTFSMQEANLLEGYYQDKWTWEDPSSFNRHMWNYCRNIRQGKRGLRMNSMQMEWYYLQYLDKR